MRLLLLGGPGAGKGTQGARLAERLAIEHVAAGDALRAEVYRGTEIGNRIEKGAYPDRVAASGPRRWCTSRCPRPS